MTLINDALKPTAVARPVAVVRLVGKIAAFPKWVRNFLQNRSALRHLSEMSDWQLADIGLTRSDIDWAAMHTPRGSETRRLSQLASERARAEDASRRIC